MNPILSALLWVILFVLGSAVTFLPRSWEISIGRFLGRLVFYLAPKRLDIAKENMRRCLPELTDAQRRDLLRANCEHYGILALELAHMFSPFPGHYRRYVLRVTVLEGFENWERVHVRGRGVLFMSAHLANWELMTSITTLKGVPAVMVTRNLKPAWLLRKVEAARRSTGIEAAYETRSAAAVLKAMRAKKSVGFVLDQYAPAPGGIPALFFGAKVLTFGAMGPLAERTGAGIIPVYQRRDEKGIVHVAFEPEIDLGPAAKDPSASVQILVSKVESWIRECPSQWLWVHRRFKNAEWPGDSVRRRPLERGRE